MIICHKNIVVFRHVDADSRRTTAVSRAGGSRRYVKEPSAVWNSLRRTVQRRQEVLELGMFVIDVRDSWNSEWDAILRAEKKKLFPCRVPPSKTAAQEAEAFYERAKQPGSTSTPTP